MATKGMVEVSLGNLKPRAQVLASTCWLTCYQMLYEWKGADRTTIEGKIKGAGVDWDEAVKTGLKNKDDKKSGDALGLSCWASSDGWNAREFKNFIKSGSGPIWVAGKWQTTGHVVVVIGASDDHVKFIDPWWQGNPEAEIKTWASDSFQAGTNQFHGFYGLQFWKSTPKPTPFAN
jgi:hypothetical protein